MAEALAPKLAQRRASDRRRAAASGRAPPRRAARGPRERGRATAGRPGEQRRRDTAGTTERAVASERAVAEWQSKRPLAPFYGGAIPPVRSAVPSDTAV